jgi:hypothetical protein
MARWGWASDYCRYSFYAYSRAEQHAKDRRLGIWAGGTHRTLDSAAGEWIRLGRQIDDSKKSIWRAAQVMVKRYGEDAAFEAASCVDEMLDEGDIDRCPVRNELAAIG